LRDDLRLDLGAPDEGPPELDRAFRTLDQKDLVKSNCIADIADELLDPELVARADSVLLSACFDDRVHRFALLKSTVTRS